MAERIGIIGLGYVGLPVALAFARKYEGTVGYDVSAVRVEELRAGHDRTEEVEDGALADTTITFTSDTDDLRGCTFFVVAVPTPIDGNRSPDMRALVSASRTVGGVIRPGAVIVYESTVYPGVTQDVCGPALEETSRLRAGVDFQLAYSPERINPGDKEHTLERVVKVVGADHGPTLERVAAAYEAIVPAGVHRAPSIKVAEAAKVIENTQRDLNIALMNELALIFDRMGIRTKDVLDAAGTKWNFLKFRPGLVGGHCIGVDPYYLTTCAEGLGYHPAVILAGRRINDGMAPYVAQRLVKMLIAAKRPVNGAAVGILGLTFKENIPDLRNSKVPDIVRELRQFGIEPAVHDPMADADEALAEYGLELVAWDELGKLNALVLAVPHRQYLERDVAELLAPLAEDGILIDVCSALDPASIPGSISYWSM